MKQRLLYCCLAALALQFFFPIASQAKEPEPQIQATIHLDQKGAPIHPFVHGMFTELLGNMFENGIWAEMLSDRKFFYPIDNPNAMTVQTRIEKTATNVTVPAHSVLLYEYTLK